VKIGDAYNLNFDILSFDILDLDKIASTGTGDSKTHNKDIPGAFCLGVDQRGLWRLVWDELRLLELDKFQWEVLALKIHSNQCNDNLKS
jgi:hypothetical protein